MKKSILLLTATLCAVCAVTLAGCNSDKNGSSATERLNTQIVTQGDEPAEVCPDGDDCPDCNPEDGCKDGKCGKKRMPRAKHNGNKRPAKEDCTDDYDEDDCEDGEVREFDERTHPHRRHPRRKHGNGRRIPAPTEPINEVKPKG